MNKENPMQINDDDLKKIELYIHNITLRVGALIKDFRKRKKLTIAELSKRARVSSTVITDLENGRSLPRTEVLLKLAYALDLFFERLFSEFMPKQVFKNLPSAQYVPPSLDEMIMQEGLGTIDAKEVMQFIEFKKFQNSKRK